MSRAFVSLQHRGPVAVHRLQIAFRAPHAAIGCAASRDGARRSPMLLGLRSDLGCRNSSSSNATTPVFSASQWGSPPNPRVDPCAGATTRHRVPYPSRASCRTPSSAAGAVASTVGLTTVNSVEFSVGKLWDTASRVPRGLGWFRDAGALPRRPSSRRRRPWCRGEGPRHVRPRIPLGAAAWVVNWTGQ